MDSITAYSNLNGMDWAKNFLFQLNKKGIPLPLIYDSARRRGSVTLSMFWISFQVCLIALMGKWTHKLDVEYSNCIWLYVVSGGFYLGRSISTDKHGAEVGDKGQPINNQNNNIIEENNVEENTNVVEPPV